MADNNKENKMSIDDFDFAHEDAIDDTSMLVNYLVTRLHQAMGNPALQGEVQQQLHAYGILPPPQQERDPEKSHGETSKRGLSTAREVENPYQELKQLLEGKPSSKKKGHAQHERSPSREREGSESQDKSMEDVAPRRRRAQRSPTPTKQKRSHIVLTAVNQKEKRRAQGRRRRERGHPLLHLHHPLPLLTKVVGILLKKSKGEDTEGHMLLGRGLASSRDSRREERISLSSPMMVTLPKPLGIVFELSKAANRRIFVAELIPNGNAERATRVNKLFEGQKAREKNNGKAIYGGGVNVGDLLLATTMVNVKVDLFGLRAPQRVVMFFATEGRTWTETMGAIQSSYVADGPVTLVLEREN
ncbi:hypothetical protein L7F22_020569 [Adiantum nelumboides]|nr:hypothetical protein [Adiantum nelumboides]